MATQSTFPSVTLNIACTFSGGGLKLPLHMLAPDETLQIVCGMTMNNLTPLSLVLGMHHMTHVIAMNAIMDYV